jgi:hypothetical protein
LTQTPAVDEEMKSGTMPTMKKMAKVSPLVMTMKSGKMPTLEKMARVNPNTRRR